LFCCTIKIIYCAKKGCAFTEGGVTTITSAFALDSLLETTERDIKFVLFMVEGFLFGKSTVNQTTEMISSTIRDSRAQNSQMDKVKKRL